MYMDQWFWVLVVLMGLSICVDHWFWVLVVLMGLSICVHVHGPLVLGFGSFHGFDGPVHLCACTWTNGFGFWRFSWF